MNYLDKVLFIQAVAKKIIDLVKNEVWEYIPYSSVHSNNKIFREV